MKLENIYYRSRLLLEFYYMRFASKSVEYGDFYDLFADEFQSYFALQKQDDLYMYEKASAHFGGPILEVACGNGRVSRLLSDYEVFGFDLSRRLLKSYRSLSSAENDSGSARFFVGDMRNFAVQEKFRLVVVPYNSFNHLTDEESQLSCLEAINRALVPGGHLLMELLPYHSEYQDGIRCRIRNLPGRDFKLFSKLKHDKVNEHHHVEWYGFERDSSGRMNLRIARFTRMDISNERLDGLLKKSGLKQICLAEVGENSSENRFVLAEKS